MNKFFGIFAIMAALLLAGCAAAIHIMLDDQSVTIVADDDDSYDFYVDGKLECRNTYECNFFRSTHSRCQMTIEAKRGEIVLGTLQYGYWDEPPLIVKMLINDQTDRNKCPEGLFGARAKVEINKFIKKQVDAAEMKERLERADNLWNKSPLSSSSKELEKNFSDYP